MVRGGFGDEFCGPDTAREVALALAADERKALASPRCCSGKPPLVAACPALEKKAGYGCKCCYLQVYALSQSSPIALYRHLRHG